MEMDEFRKAIWKKIENLEKQHDEFHTDMIRLTSWMGSEFGYRNNTKGNVYRHLDDLHEDMKKLIGVIDGNGKPGHKSRITMLEERMKGVYWLGGIVLIATIGLISNAIIKVVF